MTRLRLTVLGLLILAGISLAGSEVGVAASPFPTFGMAVTAIAAALFVWTAARVGSQRLRR